MTCKKCGHLIDAFAYFMGGPSALCLMCKISAISNPVMDAKSILNCKTESTPGTPVPPELITWKITPPAPKPTRTDELLAQAVADVRANHAAMMQRQHPRLTADDPQAENLP